MNFAEFRKANVLRCESPKPNGFGHPLQSWDFMQWGCATGGEIGEAQNIAKKLGRYKIGNEHMNKAGEYPPVLITRMTDEIADGIVYADLWLASAGFTMEEVVRRVFNQKSLEMGSNIYV